MADYTVEDYKVAARKAIAGGDIASANELIAAGQALEAKTTKTAEVDTSVSGAAKFGYDNAGKLIGQGIQGVGELTGSEGIENYGKEMAERNEREIAEANYQRPEGADGIIKNLREGDLANAGKSLLYGSAEAAPQVLAGTAASIGAGLAVTSAPIVGTTIAVGGTVYGTLSALGETRDENEEKGIDTTATMQDLGAAVTSGLIELLPVKGGGYTVKVLREGIQEAGQEAVIIGNTAIKGGEYVTDEVVNRIGDAGLIGSTLSGAANTAISTVTKTGEVVFKPRQELAPEVDQAAGDVSRMIKEISEDSGYNLKDIDPSSQKGANQTLLSVRNEVQKEVNAAAKEINKQIVKDLDPESIEKFKRIVNTSNLKVGGSVTPADIQFVKDLAGSTEVGQKMVNGLYKSNVVTELYASGLKGGFSKFTDVFNPINNVGKGYNPARDVAGMLNFGAIAGTGGASLATQIPLVAGGRAIDAVTGRRSKVNRFVKKNIKKSGLNTPTGTSLPLNKAQQAQAEKKIRDANNRAMKKAADDKARAEEQALFVKMYEEGLHPNPRSPRGIAFEGLREVGNLGDMTPAQIDAEIMRAIDRRLAKGADADVRRALNAYKSHLKTGKMPDNDKTLSYTVSIIKNGFKFPKIDPAAPTSPVAPTPPAPPQRSPEVQQGIDDNRKFVQNLIDKLDKDKAVSDSDRLVLNNSLSEYQLSLGKDPKTASQALVDRARKNLSNEKLADKYLMPYHTRVVSQQAAINTGVDKPNGDTGTTGSPPTAVSPTPPVLEPQPTPAPSPEEATGGTQQEPNVGDGGDQGVLGTPEPVGTNPPTPEEVQAEVPEAEALVEIGKKGTKYENGIQDWATALDVAKKLNLVVNAFKSITALRTAGKASGYKVKPATQAFFSEYGNKGGAGGTIFTMVPNASKGKNKKTGKLRRVSDIQALTTLLHEMAHGVAEGYMSGKGISEPQSKRGKNVVTGQMNSYGDGTFTGSVIAPLLMSKDLTATSPIMKEIVDLQWNIKAYAENNPNATEDVREFAKIVDHLMKKNPSMTQADAIEKFSTNPSLKAYQQYAMNFSETAVDPLWVYMLNPRLAKELMPETTKVIRDEFKKAGNKQIRFYSSSFATILAIVSAMIAKESGEDEEPNEGILSPQDGILSA